MNANSIFRVGCHLILVIVLSPLFAYGQQVDAPAASDLNASPGVVVPGTKPPPESADKTAADKASDKKSPGWDPGLVSSGESAFQNYCISCHDANRSLDKKKSLGSWRATVKRMNDNNAAEVPSNVMESIAVYLTARNQASGETGGTASPDDLEEEPFSIYATVSPLWRGGNNNLENSGFFSDVWVGAAWQSSRNPISARATACITCHTEPGQGSRIDLVDAVIRLDLTKWLSNGCEPCERSAQASVEAGRFVVPFGAFSKQVNPGVYRTVSRPLIYTMGQRVFKDNLGDPVLPMPYSDEGANLNVSKPVWDDIVATGDFYVVNGLQGGDGGVNFYQSRDYSDNNKTPAIGTRATIGDQNFKVGGSIMSGRFNNNSGSGPNANGLNYWIYGADATYHYEDILRLQFEYAQRDNDRFVNLPNQLFSRDRVGGYFFEAELLLSRKYKWSLINRYDSQTHNSVIPMGNMTTGNFTVSRYTYGLNYVLPGGSLVMFNVEHWFLPNPLKDLDVVGVRWAATF